MSNYIKALICMIGSSVLVSFGGLFLKVIEWHPIATIGLRSLITLICMYPLIPKPVFARSKAVYLGGLAFALQILTYAVAIQYTTAANAIMIQYTAPIYVIIINFMVNKERPSRLDMTTVLIVMAGLLLFFLDDLSLGSTKGNVLSLLSGICYACMVVCLRKEKDDSSLRVLFWGNVFIFLSGIPFMAYAGMPDAGSLGMILVAGVFQMALPYILMAYAVKRLSAVETILLAVLEPILNPVWVFLVVGEAPGVKALLGTAVVIVAITRKSLVELKSDGKQSLEPHEDKKQDERGSSRKTQKEEHSALND